MADGIKKVKEVGAKEKKVMVARKMVGKMKKAYQSAKERGDAKDGVC